MSQWLRQSTASQEIELGRFVDSTDGDTEETGLTIANTDIKLWKEGATTLASKNSGGATHIANGVYYAVLDATDTNTLGKLTIHVHVAGALSVKKDCMVLPAMVYDSLVLGTDYLDVNTRQLNSADTADNLSDFASEYAANGYANANVTLMANNVITAAAAAADFGTEVGSAMWASATRTLTANTNLAGLTVDVTKWNGSAVAVPTVAGVPEVDLTHITGNSAIADLAAVFFSAFDGSDLNVNIGGSVGSVVANVSVGSIAANTITAASIAADAGTEIATAVWASGTRTVTSLSGLTVDTVTTLTNKTGFVLASTGLDSISTTAPTGVASNFREMVVQTWRRFFKKSTLTSTELKTYADNGSTVLTTQTVSDDLTTETQGTAS